MKHVIVFCYIFTILIGVSALTIQWLAGKGDKEKVYGVMKPFIMMLLFMNVYDFCIFYVDNITNGNSGNLMLSIGDCLIAVLVYLWLKVEVNICSADDCKWLEKVSGYYVAGYLATWLAGIFFFREWQWVRLIIDLPLMAILIIGSILCIRSGLKHGDSRYQLAYKGIITTFMAVNYITYFANESGLWSNSEVTIMNLTIFFWLVINAANIILLYRRDFSHSYLQEAPAAAVPLNVEEALDEVKMQYELTKREVEILKEVYDGKTNTQIAEELFISESTVKAHIYNIFRKLDVKNRIEAVCIVREAKEK